MRIVELFKQLSSEGIEGLFAHKYAEFARSPVTMTVYQQIASDAAQHIQSGRILEIGPGPGFISIEIAKLLPQVEIVGLDASSTMVEIANSNAEEAQVASRVTFQLGNASQMPFPTESFDFVVSNGSLHEWKEPVKILNGVHDVLRNGGTARISDLRRDAPGELKQELAGQIDSWVMRWGLKKSFSEAYTREEIPVLLAQTAFTEHEISENGVSVDITLKKSS